MKDEQVTRMGLGILLLPFIVLVIAIIGEANLQTPTLAHPAAPTGNAALGQQAIQQVGCGTCHTIPGVPGAGATVGPVLAGLSRRSFIAGELPNTPENLAQWIQHPQAIKPGTAMPDMGVDESTAKNIVAYLYTLK